MPGQDELRIRMYRVGFGDFFLMTVPSAEGPQHVLIDCGVTTGTSGTGDSGTIKAAVRDMANVTGGKLALAIVTHRHKDHIIGFSRSADVFQNEMQVGAVWMSAWETEYDPDEVKGKKKKSAAAELQDAVAAYALGLQQALAAGGDKDPDGAEVKAIVENAIGPDEGPGGGSNAKSLQYLKGLNPEYYAKGDTPKLPPALQKAGLSAVILGPPPLDAVDFMKLMDLAKGGKGQYLGDNSSGGATFQPFGDAWKGETADYPNDAFRAFEREENAAEALRNAVQKASPSALFTAAKTLDDFLNNQSLVVLFTYKDQKLLFAGDAQGGNWEYWMFGGSPTKEPALADIEKESKAILQSLAFYKMGHHGSTNATPVTAVESMGEGVVALCSTKKDVFGKEANNSEVPRAPLLDALRARSTTIVRSDDAAAPLPQPKRGRFEVTELYVDYIF